MPFNSLRRQIVKESQTSYPEPHEKIAAQAKLLMSALLALGGPVQDTRPQEAPLSPVAVAVILEAATEPGVGAAVVSYDNDPPMNVLDGQP